MTIEEARKVLGDERLAITLEYSVSNETQKKRMNEKFATLNVAIEAIDKQIPKKPIREPDEAFPEESGDCPCCEASVYFWDNKYCGYCGQALDWGIDND